SRLSSFSTSTSPTVLYPLSLHDALPICLVFRRYLHSACDRVRDRAACDTLRAVALRDGCECRGRTLRRHPGQAHEADPVRRLGRSEEHTSELQSPCNLVCRLLLEKKNKA